MVKKISSIVVVILLFVFILGFIHIKEQEGKDAYSTYNSCVYVNDSLYWFDVSLEAYVVDNMEPDRLEIVGITEEVEGRLPEKHGEAVHESGKEIIYDAEKDCVYIYFEPSGEGEYRSGYLKFVKINEE